jgi:hypothetical protein
MTQPASAEVGEYQANVLLVACCMQEEWATHQITHSKSLAFLQRTDS